MSRQQLRVMDLIRHDMTHSCYVMIYRNKKKYKLNEADSALMWESERRDGTLHQAVRGPGHPTRLLLRPHQATPGHTTPPSIPRINLHQKQKLLSVLGNIDEVFQSPGCSTRARGGERRGQLRGHQEHCCTHLHQEVTHMLCEGSG